MSPPREVAVLRIRDPLGGEQVAVIDRPCLQIGSSPADCGLVLHGPGIAPRHCCLRWRADRWWLLDRGSPAGVYLNDRRCHEPAPLQPGDRISLAYHLVEFSSLPALEPVHVLARLGDAPEWPGEPAPASPQDAAATGRLRDGHLAALLTLALTLLALVGYDPPARDDAGHGLVAVDASAGARALTAEGHELAASAHAGRPADPRVPSPAVAPPPVQMDMSSSAPLSFVTEPPGFELPSDARGLGRPDDGALVDAVQLPASPDYLLRCPAHGFGSSATVGELMHALALMRGRGYAGELVVGDLSRAGGGRYGPHRSHQSGRDVDLWLPVRGGRYRRGCAHCGTDLCRPEPGEVDWSATWQLIQALTARDAVTDIFLDWSLHPALRRGAAAQGAPASELRRRIQHPRRGAPTLVKHASGHVHHLHVRFRE